MSKKNNTDLLGAARELSELMGRPIRSNLLSEALVIEGEYKGKFGSGEDDRDEIPAFLRGADPKNPEKIKRDEKKAAEKKDEEEKPVSEQVLTQSQCVAALNEIQDRGYVRQATRTIDESTRQYTFQSHVGKPVLIRVQKIKEGFRLIGADAIFAAKT